MKIFFILNGKREVIEVDPTKPLLRVLKEEFEINSVKEGCGRGECGTCTVLLEDRPVTSCMVAAGQVTGKEVKTLEGLEAEGLAQPIQEAFINSGAVQCGFCTPGFIISAYSILKKNPMPSREEIREGISGNICRCTGYTKIIDAVEKAAEYMNHGISGT